MFGSQWGRSRLPKPLFAKISPKSSPVRPENGRENVKGDREVLLVCKKIPTSTDQYGHSASGGRRGRGRRGSRAEQVFEGPESSARLGLVHGHRSGKDHLGKRLMTGSPQDKGKKGKIMVIMTHWAMKQRNSEHTWCERDREEERGKGKESRRAAKRREREG